MFLLKFAELCAKGLSLKDSFSQENIPNFRRLCMISLIQNVLVSAASNNSDSSGSDSSSYLVRIGSNGTPDGRGGATKGEPIYEKRYIK